MECQVNFIPFRVKDVGLVLANHILTSGKREHELARFDQNRRALGVVNPLADKNQERNRSGKKREDPRIKVTTMEGAGHKCEDMKWDGK